MLSTDAPINKPNSPPQLEMKLDIVSVSDRLTIMKFSSLNNILEPLCALYLCLKWKIWKHWYEVEFKDDSVGTVIQRTHCFYTFLSFLHHFQDDNVAPLKIPHCTLSKYNRTNSRNVPMPLSLDTCVQL